MGPHHSLAAIIESQPGKLSKHHCQFGLNGTGDQLLCAGAEQLMEWICCLNWLRQGLSSLCC